MGKTGKWMLAIVAAAVLGPASGGHAQQISSMDVEVAEQSPAGKTLVKAGLGLALVPDYEGSDDSKVAPLLYFRGVLPSGQFVNLIGTTVMANVLPNNAWQVGPLLRYRGKREDVNNDQVDAMETVDAAWQLGGFVGYQYEHWNARVDAAQDVSGGNDGFLLTVKGGYTYPVDAALALALNLAVTYANEEYMQTYFGVSRVDAARSGLRRYDPDGGIKNVGAAVIATYSFNPTWGLLGGVVFNRLVGDAADSPVVDDAGNENQLTAGVAVTYCF